MFSLLLLLLLRMRMRMRMLLLLLHVLYLTKRGRTTASARNGVFNEAFARGPT